jgi:hypothetical protein
MSVRLTEPVVAALVARLTSDLTAQIDQVNAEATDEIAVRYPQRVLDHLPTLEVMTAFPVVAIGEGAGNLTDDTGHSMTGQYTISVLVYESDADQQVLTTRLRRLRLAAFRTVVAGRTLPTADGSGIAAFGLDPRRLIAGDRLADFDRSTQKIASFMGYCGFTVECLTDENA